MLIVKRISTPSSHTTKRNILEYVLSSRLQFIDHVHSLVLTDAEEFLPSFFGNPSSKEWTKFNPNEVVSNVLMHYATSLVLGPKFSRDPILMQHITAHALGIEEVINEFARWPRFLFPLVWRLSPLHRKFRSNISVVRKKVVPEIKRRVQLLRLGESTGEDMSMLTIFLKQALKEGLLSMSGNTKTEENDIEGLFMKTLFHIYEVWGPIAPLLSAMFVRCMANPEYVDALREEVSGSLESHGGWNSNFLAHTPKLESFMRESLRLIESLDMNLPKGTCIGIPTKCVHGDPKNYPDPTRFDGYRFYDADSNTCTVRASTASEKFLAFSYGTGLCPGRFIGVKVSEILLVKVLLDFDMQFISKGQEFPSYVLMENTWSWLDTNLTAYVRSRSGHCYYIGRESMVSLRGEGGGWWVESQTGSVEYRLTTLEPKSTTCLSRMSDANKFPGPPGTSHMMPVNCVSSWFSHPAKVWSIWSVLQPPKEKHDVKVDQERGKEYLIHVCFSFFLPFFFKKC
ncbi:uncharacterized protein ARB_05641 [Trichophyton benhamiae CBS 112371]|uniref:Cytochrome P450 n=1 Tax=Arthroderma benhamiae (strain ATCC MYA-4681 / CBS 112371) TaxID=663331 RepID=D4AN37_ARTBC|nr:uncharacterized protein ARB_05641 [Trichophyton benhamiae CBS 112371]EFE35598.1 hypothetical protein ARB_05641 [Trichophyton benhamiae CBS 112371]